MKNSVFYYLYSIDALNIDVKSPRSFFVTSSFVLRYFSVTPSLYLSYASVMPPLYIRFVNEGRSSSQRRMIEFTTKDERRTNEGTTEKKMLYQQYFNIITYIIKTYLTANLQQQIPKANSLDYYRCWEF